MQRLGLVLLVVSLASPTAASASTVSLANGELRFIAAPGEENFGIVSVDGSDFSIQDGDASISAGDGCTRPTPAFVRCPTAGVSRISADLGNRDDTFAISLPVSAPPTTVSGGAGTDRVQYGPDPVSATLDGVANDGPAPRTDNLLADVEEVEGGPNGDTLAAGSYGALLAGGPGLDTLMGGPRGDLIDARDPVQCPPDDTAVGCEEPERDTVSCGGGSDVVDADRRDQVTRDCEVVAVRGVVKLTRRADRFTAFRSGLVIRGGAGNDRLATGEWSATIDGGAGNDQIRGGVGSSRLVGGRGRDVITSDDESDEILVRDGEVDRVRCGAVATPSPRTRATGWPAIAERVVRG